MKFIKEYYKSMFYFFYKLDFVFGYPWWSEIKALVVIMVFEVIVLYSLIGFVSSIFDFDIFSLIDMKVYNIISAVMLTGLHYWQFFIRNNWKEIVKEYEQLPPSDRTKNYLKMLGINILVVLVFASFMVWLYKKNHV